MVDGIAEKHSAAYGTHNFYGLFDTDIGMNVMINTLGNRRAIIMEVSLMTLGHASMAMETHFSCIWDCCF